MMRVISLGIALVLPLLMFAQRLSHPVSVSRDDAFSSPAAPLAGTDTVRVLALMVQFQKDTDTRTSGEGQFDLTTVAAPVMDSPPHDAAYFRNHLLFLQNYFARSSKGKLVVQSTLIDQVVTLSTTMGTYAPARGGTNQPVANLAVDSWHAADSLHLVPDFSAYNAFVVLHAGVGHDIDLVSQLGYDPTPLDIPSLYIGLSAFRGFYGDSYQGIPVNGGAFHIPNSLVIPETETRTIPTATGDAPFVLSINGLLCASLGNYLGLPDLFNTANGASGIGRFGLMDGQGIFSWNGAFPPEPSAWEKYWLGWVTPIVVPPGTDTISLPAVSIADSIYRIPISATEYFLVENRNRDPFRTGQTVTSVYNGVTKQQTFVRDTVGFDAFYSDISALSGVVTNVSSYDWSLPGAAPDTDGTWYDGGVLIWQIDESVISQNIASDAVNANAARRGVNLKEADGSQDIGQSYGLFSAGSGSEAGTPLDFWYKGNASPVFKNEFSATTHPNSNSNTGAASHVTVDSFSVRGPRMTAIVRRGDANVSPLPEFPKSLGQQLPPQALAVSSGSSPILVVATIDSTTHASQTANSTPAVLPAKLYAWTSYGGPALTGGAQSGLIAFAPAGQVFTPGLAVGDLNGDGVLDFVVPSRQATGAGRLQAFSLRDTSPVDSLADSWLDVSVSSTVTTPPMIADSEVTFGTAGGKAYVARNTGTLVDSILTGSTAAVEGISRLAESMLAVTNTDGTLTIVRNSTKIAHPIVGPAAIGVFHGTVALAFATRDGMLYLVDGSFNTLPGFPVNTGSSINAPPALGDIDGDGLRDIVVLSGNRICAYSYLGVSLDHFPVTVSAGQPLRSNPIIADLDGNGTADVVGVTGDGVVAAVDRTGKMVRGFPIAAGQGNQSVAAFLLPSVDSPPGGVGGIALLVASSASGSVCGWITGFTGSAWSNPWPQYQKDGRHTGFDGTSLTPGTPVTLDFFPASRAYNWPNPVYDGITHIRYYIKENATVRVKIFDFAGDLVADMTGPGVGGMDNEVEWKVGSVQSGIYFARIEASGAGGSGVNIIKVAVVK